MNKKRSAFQNQIVCIFLLTFFLMFLVSLYIYSNMNSIIENIDQAYEGNYNLVEMREWLDGIHSSMKEYLNTKDPNTLNRFYSGEEKYKELCGVFEHEHAETESQIKENNIFQMSENYIQIVNKAVLAKQGKNIARYRTYQQQADELYEYLSTYMIDFNSTLFQNNSDTYSKLLHSTKFTEMMYSVILLLTGCMDICLLLLLTRRLVSPLKELADTAREVGNGNLDVQLVETDDWNEIGVVNRAFNQMVVSLRDYIEKFRQSVEAESTLKEQSIRMEASVKDAQLKYLQAQINPHFLFNTLNAGAQLAMLEDADQTYRYIHKVAEFFRFKMKKDDYTSTLQDEIQLVDDYIYIINVRYAGEICYQKHVDEQLLNITVPSMILQPIVENCIKHGFREVEWEKKIDLSVNLEGDYIVVSIRDNGIGMTQETMNAVLHNEELKDTDQEKADGIGLDNVITRMRIFYSRENVVEITSVGTNLGTEVALYIPV